MHRVAQTWTIEDVVTLNPPDSPQHTSFLDRLLEFGATSPDLLLECAVDLETRHGPFVAAFGQLPFDLGLGAIKVDAPGDRSGSTVELWLRPVRMSIDSFGRLKSLDSSDEDSRGRTTITQLVGIIRLGDKRERVHPLYVARLRNLKTLNEQLGSHMVENWMRLPEVSQGEPSRRRRPLTGFDFQRDVAARMRDHLITATRALLNAYSVSALINVRKRSYLYGYHAMLAPGRIVGAGVPIPILNGLVEPAPSPEPVSSSLRDIKDTVGSAIRADDPFIRRLQALHALCTDDEPELALIGICTALEWFLNQKFRDLSTTKRNGEVRTGSIHTFLQSRHSNVLQPETIKLLRELVLTRNDATHGAPPTQRHTRLSVSYARQTLGLALNTYRQINLSSAENAPYLKQ